MFNEISKRFGIMILALFTVVAFSACGGESTESQGETGNSTTENTSDPDVVVDEGHSHDHDGHDHDGHSHDDAGNDGNTGNTGGDNPPPPPAAPAAFDALGGSVASGSKFYIDVPWEKAAGTAHEVKVEGGVKVESTVQKGSGNTAYERVTFAATGAGPATIKIARLQGKQVAGSLTAKDWIKAKTYTLTVK